MCGGGEVKGLILTQSNLVVTWKVWPHMGIINFLIFARVVLIRSCLVCISITLLQLTFQCAKNKIK